MDINFSQIGQNFANQEASVAKSADSVEQQLLKQQGTEKAVEVQSGKENSEFADNNERDSQQETEDNIESAVKEITDFIQARNRQLAFSVDEKSERSVVKVTDSESGEVIRQIPSEEVLALSERIKELQVDVGSAVGVLFNKQA
ncbi:flagellar protein FlaG [Aliiglaciecola sp. LCG003]|uniref:flagellar protein FlaG n=1 Tax=Aliiglaciecola sp. LCG003 TaxID=3053655 RepID=UPI002573FB63|nr:flagellar protein FlaG [Aliiglaciecola sp. LCG003]WJG10564.1 flagellar protein FlaG [Aliiglaciecola sp. LCG003]